MKKRDYLLFFFLGLFVYGIVAIFQKAPGYMDADYYFMGGLRLADGHGFTEEILWNYLDDPQGIPHPSHAYWMPAASIISALGMIILRSKEFVAAQVPFVLLAAFIPPLTAKLAYSFSSQGKLALTSALFAIFPGFYLVFLTTSDTFGIGMLCGALFFILIGLDWRGTQGQIGLAFLCGLLAGIIHLSRMEGFLWLVLSFLAIYLKDDDPHFNLPKIRRLVRNCFFCGLGYLLVMAPWMLRNLDQLEALLSPGGAHAFWILSYDELYSYPASILTYSRWLESGLDQILKARLWALGQNLQSALAIQGAILLTPFILIGLWQRRSDLRIRIGGLAWLLIFLIMTFIFPYQGARGGFFHASASLQPLLWALAPLGLSYSIAWLGKRRQWNIDQAQSFLLTGAIGLLIGLTFLVTYQRFASVDHQSTLWDKKYYSYRETEQGLQRWGAVSEEIVMVNNAPGYYVANHRTAISIPYGDLETVVKLAKRYHVSYLLLEIDQIKGGSELYTKPSDQANLDYLGTVADTRVYRFLIP